MKFKKFFMFICLIICLFTIASVCAGEANDSAMTAIDSQDNLDINEDNQVIDKTDDLVGVDDSLNEPQDDNMEMSAPENIKNSDNDKLGIPDADLKADVTALNVSVADDTMFVVDCADDFKGNVSIKIGDEALYDGCVKTLLITAKLHAGNYVATAVFYGDENYGNLTLNDISFTVSRVTPTIDVSVSDVTYPRIAYANVTIGNNANGTVSVTFKGRTFNGTVSDGHAIVALIGLPAGSHTVDVEFFSNDNYNNNVNASVKFVGYPNNSLIQIYDNITNKFHVGEDIDFKIKTLNSTGNLNAYINGVYYGNLLSPNSFGDYDVSVSDKYEGTYVFTFKLDGDENYTGYETSLTVYVIKNDLSINVTNTYEDIRVGSPVIFTAKLDHNVTGNVIFTINGANYTEYVYNADVATHMYTPINNDTLTVVAIFEGNDMYNSKVSDSRDFNVTRISTNIDIDFLSQIISGDDSYISVNMDPGITCTVGLNVGDKSYDVAIVYGSGRYTVSNLNDGTYDVEVVFAGDDKYLGSTSGVKQLFVNKVPTNLSISIDKTSISYHDYAVVSINLNQSMNAVVTVKVNGGNHTVGLVNGKGSFTLNGLNKDDYIINAVFAGNDRYLGCTSNTLNLTVTGDNITSSVNISLNKYSAFAGDEVVVTVKSNPTVTGVIILNIGSKPYNVVVYKGVGTFTISDLDNGTYDVWAVFEGDDMHSGSSSDVKHLEVKKIPTNLSIDIDKTSMSVGDMAVVSLVSNQSINAVVTVKANDKTYYAAIVNGNGTLILNDLAYGIYTINAVFAGEGEYAGCISNNLTLEVNKIKTQLTADSINTEYNINKELVITLKDINGNPLRGVDVIVDLNGAKPLITDNKGQVKISTSSLTPKTYSAKIIFNGNAAYVKSTNSVKVTVKKALPKIVAKSKTFKLKVKTKKYKITLKDNQNKAMKNTKVTLKVNKKTITAKTNAKGKATFKIKNLKKKGTLKAVIKYKGNKYYKAVTKKNIKIIVK